MYCVLNLFQISKYLYSHNTQIQTSRPLQIEKINDTLKSQFWYIIYRVLLSRKSSVTLWSLGQSTCSEYDIFLLNEVFSYSVSLIADLKLPGLIYIGNFIAYRKKQFPFLYATSILGRLLTLCNAVFQITV